MKMQLTIEVGSLDELEHLMKRLNPLDEVADIDEAPTYGGPSLTEAISGVTPSVPAEPIVYPWLEKAPPSPPEITQSAMEEAMKTFARTKGMPAARALLDEFKVQRVGELVNDPRFAELYARLIG